MKTALRSIFCFFGFALLLLAQFVQAGGFNKHANIQWAAPNNHPLTMDIYVPDSGKKSYPVVVIYHGGGWLINNNSIMNSMAEYLASKGEFVVANVNYRLLGDDNNSVTMNQIVEDVFGGLLWVKDNIRQYQGNPKKIAITGDSAGGHLTAMILMSGRNLSSKGFTAEHQGFNPSYLPKGKSAEQIAKKDGLKVQAAVVSYGAFDIYQTAKEGFETASNIFWQFAKAEPRGLFGNDISYEKNPGYYQAVSPIYNIPSRKQYKLPPEFVHVGSKDTTTPPESARQYVELLKKNNQPVEFKIYPGRNHAYLDSGCNQFLGSCFDKDAIPALDDMIVFLHKILG